MSRKAAIEYLLNDSGQDWEFDDDIFFQDTWTADEALIYLVGLSSLGFDQQSSFVYVTLEGYTFVAEDAGPEPTLTESFNQDYVRLQRLWNSGMHENSNSPEYYIEWAISKNHDIPWLAYALERGFYPRPSAELQVKKLNTVISNQGVFSIKINSIHSPELVYSTDLMDILKLAICEFFSPRKQLDAKKPDIVEWIKNQGKERKVDVSNNIAEAMFTIIKPHDHNPKIKRVQSLS